MTGYYDLVARITLFHLHGVCCTEILIDEELSISPACLYFVEWVQKPIRVYVHACRSCLNCIDLPVT